MHSGLDGSRRDFLEYGQKVIVSLTNPVQYAPISSKRCFVEGGVARGGET
jgi:hypothetical protein